MPDPSDDRSYRFPVSIKGVVFVGERVVLLKNEREEWELPGGKLEPGETPLECLAREILEELDVAVEPAEILASWLYNILGKVEVLIVTYGCAPLAAASVRISHEHKELGFFSLSELDALHMPAGYKASIRQWHARCFSR